jgi:hypothetical protein
MNNSLYVQYGCGPDKSCSPETWLNFDASPTLRLARLPMVGKLLTRSRVTFSNHVKYGDIVTGLPIPHGSCSGIYCSHVLEHLSLSDFRLALKNTYDLLISKGIFRLVVPDLEAFAKKYVESNDPKAAEQFMYSTLLGIENRPRKLLDFLEFWLGNHNHLWMWDFKSLNYELASIGFVEIRKYEFGDFSVPTFKDVEKFDRFIDAIAIECRKP